MKPSLPQAGFTLFLTGLSGAGKSTLASALAQTLESDYGRTVTVLDGDVVRQHLSSDLGYSRAHRDTNILRIGYVAGEITRHGGIALCAAIAPFSETRDKVRAMIEPLGAFLELHVSTPLAVCEGRDPKGLYARARAGLVAEFTGIDSPYEAPARPEIRIDTSRSAIGAAVADVAAELERRTLLTRLRRPVPLRA